MAQRVDLDAQTLPYREDVLEFIRERKRQGDPIVLATASHERFAKAVAEHLELFDDVIATREDFNCKGEKKLQAIETHAGEREFDYMGDSMADLPILQKAKQAYLVAPESALESRFTKEKAPARVFRSEESRIKAYLKLLRPHQWAKNGLLFVPLMTSHQMTNLASIFAVGVAFVCFSCCASATYILNDLTDVVSDRRHHFKKRRPIAAGTVSIPIAVFLCGLLLVTGILGSGLLGSMALAGMMGLYVLLTTSYSYYFKRKLFVDVLLLAGLYVYRIFTGGVAADVVISHWLLGFSAFFFLSLAFAKRACELRKTGTGGENKNRNYRKDDLQLIDSLGPTCGYIAVTIFALYINDEAASALYGHPMVLWLMCPLLLYWITRIWFLVHRGELEDDPVVFAMKDRHSYFIGLLCALVLFVSTL
ncbi:MAG: UbiA family prenyltransferase [Planctomycetota bacterium]|nr:UbiA family prenyltransferase [Planctomycetota bacterium]